MINIPFLDIISLGIHGYHDSPATDESLIKHMESAVDWIQRAHSEVTEGGISKGYNLLRGQWAPSYPETTGYSIPTLLNVAAYYFRPELKLLALALADFLMTITKPEGGVVHWQANTNSSPFVFDTGQVIFGWLAAYDVSGEDRYLQSAINAGNWIISIQDQSGSWKSNQYQEVEKVIDTRVAWSLLELNQRYPSVSFVQAAKRNLDWALRQQNYDGWFDNCAFVPGEDPITHTLAYTAEGLFECGHILDESKYIYSAQILADALLQRQRSDGSLASTYKSDWRDSSRSSCLTGNCQMALLWLRFFEIKGDKTYLDAARKAILFVARTQNISTSNRNVRGGIAGSHPIYARYERFKYPNWAAKFFVDAVLALNKAGEGSSQPFYPG